MNNEATIGSTLKGAGTIGTIALFGAIIGLLLQQLLAYYFGAATETDAYFMAQSTSEMLGKLLLGGSITAVFLPLFVQRLAAGNRREAQDIALNLLHLLGVPYAVLLVLLLLFAEPFVRLIAPGFDPVTAELTVGLLRVLLPSFLFLLLVDVMVAMLHSLREFGVPARLRLIAPTVLIISLVLLVHRAGIYALAIGATLGAAVQLAYVGWGLYQHGFRYRWVFAPADPTVRRLLWLVYPFILSMLATQGAAIVYRVLASELAPGSLSAIKYAEKITQLITIMFLNSVTTVIYPLLSAQAGRRQFGTMQQTLAGAVRLTTLVTVPIVIGVAMLREPFVSLLYQRGSFTPEAAALTSTALLFLVIGLTTNALSSVLGHAVLALQQTRWAVAVTVVSHAMAIILFVLLVPRLQLAGLALASSLVPLSSSLLYYLYLQRRVPRLHTVIWHTTYLKVAVLGILLAGILYATRHTVAALPLPSGLLTLATVVVPAIVGSAVFFGGAWWWGITEAREIAKLLRTKFPRYSTVV